MSNPYAPPQSANGVSSAIIPRWRRILVSCGLSAAGTLLVALAMDHGLPNSPWSMSLVLPVWLGCVAWVTSTRAGVPSPTYQRVLIAIVAFVAMVISSFLALILSVVVLPD